jgi:hypothetical protein
MSTEHAKPTAKKCDTLRLSYGAYDAVDDPGNEVLEFDVFICGGDSPQNSHA